LMKVNHDAKNLYLLIDPFNTPNAPYVTQAGYSYKKFNVLLS
jgi:hypothetical protein